MHEELLRNLEIAQTALSEAGYKNWREDHRGWVFDEECLCDRCMWCKGA